jgi:aminoglycoside phosphotransferase (APT) family kinase protein
MTSPSSGDPAGAPPPPASGRDLAKTAAALETWLASRLGDAREVAVAHLAPPGGTGFSNDTLLFELSWRDGAGARHERALVARIAPAGVPVFRHYDVAKQYRAMALAARHGVPVPELVGLETGTATLGSPFFVMARAAGRVPTDNPPYHTGGWVSELRPEERARLWWSGLDAMARIHRIDPAREDVGFLAEGDGSAAAALDHWRRYLVWAAEGRPQPVCERALAWLEAHRPASAGPVRVCWGDARIGNMVFDDGRCTAVLDWEMVTLGDPQQDLAWWLFLDRHHSEGVGAARLPGFPGRDETVARFEAETGLVARELDWYEVFAGFRFGAVMIRVARQLAALSLLPAGSTFETDNTVTRLLARLLDRLSSS